MISRALNWKNPEYILATFAFWSSAHWPENFRKIITSLKPHHLSVTWLPPETYQVPRHVAHALCMCFRTTEENKIEWWVFIPAVAKKTNREGRWLFTEMDSSHFFAASETNSLGWYWSAPRAAFQPISFWLLKCAGPDNNEMLRVY